MSLLDKPVTNADVERLTMKLHQAGLIHSCLTCGHFAEHGQQGISDQDTFPAEHCTLYNLHPPARVIAYGCESWQEGLPF